jgi:hypothetical protein
MARIGSNYCVTKEGKVVKTQRRMSVSQRLSAKRKTRVVRGKRYDGFRAK